MQWYDLGAYHLANKPIYRKEIFENYKSILMQLLQKLIDLRQMYTESFIFWCCHNMEQLKYILSFNIQTELLTDSNLLSTYRQLDEHETMAEIEKMIEIHENKPK